MEELYNMIPRLVYTAIVCGITIITISVVLIFKR